MEVSKKVLEFIARVQIGDEILGYGNSSMIVTGVSSRGFVGYAKYPFEKYGETRMVSLSFSTIANPHSGEMIIKENCENLKTNGSW